MWFVDSSESRKRNPSDPQTKDGKEINGEIMI